MRQVILDTETTGLEVAQGHRVIEIGCVELLNRRLTGRHFHRYLNPERDIDEGARAVHGISRDKLADKPRFADVAAEFCDFVAGSELVIHNAPFDIAFLDAEFLRLPAAEPTRLGSLCRVLDTLALARGLHPGQRNSLDALCRRYGIDNSRRELHGALLDARILADVYLAMTGGQSALALDVAHTPGPAADGAAAVGVRPPRATLFVRRANAAEREAHAALQEQIQAESRGRCLWRTLDAPGPGSADEAGKVVAAPPGVAVRVGGD